MHHVHTITYYRIAENVGRRKHWQIQLFRLFEGENFGEWPTYNMDVEDIVNLREKYWVIGHQFAKFINVLSRQHFSTIRYNIM